MVPGPVRAPRVRSAAAGQAVARSAAAFRLVTVRLLAVLAAAGACLLGLAAPAAAHAGGARPSNWVSTVDSVAPAMAGVTVRTLANGNVTELVNTSPVTITVLGYDGEPYLRIGPRGTEENARSAAAYLNRTLDSRSTVPDSAADPAVARASPDWRSLSSEPIWRWHDHRTHWMESTPPPPVRAEPDRPHEIARWQLDFLYGQTPVAVTGRLVWVPPPSPWPYAGLAVAGLAAGAMAGWSRRWWRPALGGLLGVLAASGVAHAAAERSPVDAMTAAVGLGLAVAAFVAIRRSRPSAPYLLALTGAVVLAVDGMAGLGALTASQLPAGGPAWVVRLSVALALGLGLGLVVGGWQVWRREQPVPAATEAVPSA